MATPTRFAHVVYRCGDFDAMIDWHTTVLEAEVVLRNDRLAFATYDEEHHRVAFIRDPRAAGTQVARDHAGVEHVAYTYADLGDLADKYVTLRDRAITPEWCVNHGPTTSMYYRDPDGNRVELQVDNYPTTQELNDWFRSGAMEENPIGVGFDPEDLVTKVAAGVPIETLRVRPPGPFEPGLVAPLGG